MSNPAQIRARPGCRIRAHDIPPFGLVLEAVLSGRQDPEFWEGVRGALGEEVARRAPHYLVFDLRTLDCIVGSTLVGGLVAGALEMTNLGRLGRTKIVATGRIARRLTKILPLCRLEPILGVIHPDLESALAEDRPARGTEPPPIHDPSRVCDSSAPHPLRVCASRGGDERPQ